MRPRFQWEAYEGTRHQLKYLTYPPYRQIIQLIGCHTKTGVTIQFILDNVNVPTMPMGTKTPEQYTELIWAVEDLVRQGLVRKETTGIDFYEPRRDHYKVNWTVIKAINNAIKRLP